MRPDNIFTRNQIADSHLIQLKAKVTLKIDYSNGRKEIFDGVTGRPEPTEVQTRNIRIRVEGGKTVSPDP